MNEINKEINYKILDVDVIKVVKEYNKLMKEGIIGPDCTNPNICHGDCCSIFIDIPMRLAKEIINQGFADEDDFIRGNIFAFQLRIDEKTGKCVFFDKRINGCALHNSGLKPPQCWIYPTNFNTYNKIIKCKRADGWKIIKPEKVKKAEKLLKRYTKWSLAEFMIEIKQIKKRIKNKLKEKFLEERIQEIRPSEFAGFKDAWNYFKILKAEGLSLQTKKFCEKFNSNCSFLPDRYFECSNICESVATNLVKVFYNSIDLYLKKRIPDKGDYPLIKLSGFFKG
jgi:Fe-S-cluster containining protein